MNYDKLKEIEEFAKGIGFRARVADFGYATFGVRTDNFIIDIRYDITRTKFSFTTEAVSVSTSSMNTDDMDVLRDFKSYVEKAIVIADKLRETKVNGCGHTNTVDSTVKQMYMKVPKPTKAV